MSRHNERSETNEEDTSVDGMETLIEEQFASGQIDRDSYEQMMVRAHELQEQIQEDRQELQARQYHDPVDAHLDALGKHRKRAAKKRALERDALGIDLDSLNTGYEQLLNDLGNSG